MHVTELLKLHGNLIRQIEYVESINSIISAAECQKTSNINQSLPGIVISSLGTTKSITEIRANRGMSCFFYDSKNEILATGGPDCILRLWNPITPQKALAILPGHHAGITFIFIQDNGKTIYSIDKQKVIKIWDGVEHKILQTYILLASVLQDRCPVSYYYNNNTRELISGGMKIALNKCCPLLNLNITDGDTHTRPVSVVLYNKLFKCVVTCGTDSFIIVWDIFTGFRLNLIKMAHTRTLNGEILRVEITAACFDPKYQLLLTGARDGTIKMWNFMTGLCKRNLSLEYMCEVTGLFWVPNRILAVGWNRHVIEFADSGESEYGKGKNWDICHVDDVLAGAVKIPETLVTTSYSGELILWKLETGQPYRRYDVGNPTNRIKV